VVEVPDDRLGRLASVVKPERVIQPSLRFVDIAGLAKGAHRGEGLGNRFLSYIRGVDAVAHVLRCFEDQSVAHVEGGIDPVRDLEIVETELFLSDVQVLDRRIEKIAKIAKSGDQHARKESAFLTGIKASLDEGRRFEMPGDVDPELGAVLAEVQLLSAKPVIYVANVGDDPRSQRSAALAGLVTHQAEARGTIAVPISAKLEAEIVELDPEEGCALLTEIGFEDNALKRFVRACYDLLQVITFFTIKGEETRGWTVRRGTGVRDAAGKIHSDMRDNFVCAEVISFDDFMASGGMAEAREQGLVRTEGKNYTVRDADIILVKFGR
jgi:GTP-binding protein YchF